MRGELTKVCNLLCEIRNLRGSIFAIEKTTDARRRGDSKRLKNSIAKEEGHCIDLEEKEAASFVKKLRGYKIQREQRVLLKKIKSLRAFASLVKLFATNFTFENSSGRS